MLYVLQENQDSERFKQLGEVIEWNGIFLTKKFYHNICGFSTSLLSSE